MKLHQDKDKFKDAIIATSQSLNIKEIFIEKDYWITYILKNLSKSEYKDIAIFKGGTSLSKAYGLISRFSEDIDLAIVLDENMRANQTKTLIRNISKSVTSDLIEDENDNRTSKKSRFRKIVYSYQKEVKSTDFGHATDKLIVEINSFACPNPYFLMKIRSYITEFLEKNQIHNIIDEYELGAFEINVLGVERTFTEKILALVRASYSDNPYDQLKNKIRHTYDLHMILQDKNIKSFLNSNKFFDSLIEVKKDDARNSEFYGDWINNPLSKCILFSDLDKTWNTLENFYNTEFKTLVYSELPKSHEIKSSLKMILDRLIVFDTSIIVNF